MTFWIGSVAKKKDDSKDPTGVFKKVDQLLPEKPSWKIEHIRLKASLIRCVATRSVQKETTLSSFLTADQDGPVPRPKRSRKQDVEDIME